MPSPQQLFGPAPDSRESWARAAVAVVSPATRLAVLGPELLPAHATTNSRAAAWFEMVARPLWGLGAYSAGGFTNAARQWEQVREALVAAIDPGHPWYIGPPADLEQRLVEAAAVGYALAVAPQELWEPLSPRQRELLADWLAAASAAVPHDNNWCFFPVLAATGLKHCGVPVNEDLLAERLDRIDQFALPNGWYKDGAGSQQRPGVRDYYVPFGFHYYGLLLAKLGAVDAERAARYRERAVAFASQFQHWFGADGAAVHFGRSMGYRFAQSAFWSMLAAADLPALEWPVVRGFAQRNMAWWWQQPILSEEGSLTVGYSYPNSAVVEEYMGAGSPYWGTKAFAALAAPAVHPFWTAAATPAQGAQSAVAQPVPTMILIRDQHGDVTALNGQGPPAFDPRGAAAKYTKLAYSSLAGFSVPGGEPSLVRGGFDSTLALSDDGEQWRVRVEGQAAMEGLTILVGWQPWPDVLVETRLAPDRDGHLREHRIVTGRNLHTADLGFCVPCSDRATSTDSVSATRGYARAAAGGIVSEVVGDSGWDGEVLRPMPGTHLLFTRSLLPVLRTTLLPGEHVLKCHVRVYREA